MIRVVVTGVEVNLSEHEDRGVGAVGTLTFIINLTDIPLLEQAVFSGTLYIETNEFKAARRAAGLRDLERVQLLLRNPPPRLTRVERAAVQRVAKRAGNRMRLSRYMQALLRLAEQ